VTKLVVSVADDIAMIFTRTNTVSLQVLDPF